MFSASGGVVDLKRSLADDSENSSLVISFLEQGEKKIVILRLLIEYDYKKEWWEINDSIGTMFVNITYGSKTQQFSASLNST